MGPKLRYPAVFARAQVLCARGGTTSLLLVGEVMLSVASMCASAAGVASLTSTGWYPCMNSDNAVTGQIKLTIGVRVPSTSPVASAAVKEGPLCSPKEAQNYMQRKHSKQSVVDP